MGGQAKAMNWEPKWSLWEGLLWALITKVKHQNRFPRSCAVPTVGDSFPDRKRLRPGQPGHDLTGSRVVLRQNPHHWMKPVRASAFISQWADNNWIQQQLDFFNNLWKVSSLCNSRVVCLDTSFPALCAYFPTFHPVHLLHFSRLIRRHSRWQGREVFLRPCIITW